MKVIFLCGGIGRRMSPITEDKFLVEFLGKTLVEHQIEKAVGVGLKEFVFVANPQNIERIEKIAESLSGVTIEIALQKEPLGIANALKSAEHFLKGEIIIVNPNDVFESSAYTGIIAASRGDSAFSYILGYEVAGYFPGGYLVMDEQNYLKRIVEKPPRGKEPSRLVNILIHLHTSPEKLLEYIKKVDTTRDNAYECALDEMTQERRGIEVVSYRNFWQAVKYPWHIFEVIRYFLDRSPSYISPSADISEKATIKGKVILGDNVRVLENAVIRGPVYIGANSVIGNNALVRDYSHIGAGCVVGYGTEVKGSYIGNGCWFHSSYIGDSIISDECSFGAGTVLTNFRFDEGNIKVRVQGEVTDTERDKLGAIVGSKSKTGVNVSIMPGIKIGPNSFVGSHVSLARDLEPNKFIVATPQYKIMENTIEVDEKKKQDYMGRLAKCVE